MLAFALALATLVAACGSSGGSAGGPTTGKAATDTALGTPKKATGTPLKIGFVTDGRSAALDNSSELEAAKAAVSYVNDYLGGVAGHPLSVTVCETRSTPSGATDCGNQMVAQHVTAVLVGTSGQGGSVAPPILKAGIPYVAYQPSSAAELTGKNSFSLTGASIAIAGGVAKYSQEKGYKSVVVLSTDVPTLRASMDPLFKPPFTKAGIGFSAVFAPLGTPDLTSQFASADQKKPDAYFLIGNPAWAVSSLKAMKGLGISKPTFILEQEVDPSVVKAVPGGLAGTLLVTTSNLSPADKDFELYTAVIKKYAPGTTQGGLAIGGFAVVVGLARGLAGVTGDVTATKIETQLQAVHAQLPVSGGITFSCGKSLVSFLPALCSIGSQITPLTADGKPTTYVKIDPTDLYQR